MASIDTYYKVLGIRSAASLDDIKRVFLEMEQGLQSDFESEDPEKRTRAREKLNELYGNSPKFACRHSLLFHPDL